ncbi:S41 family peptidase [Cetobacterium somerae]|uniref:S41 family peptidase n=1 Tax=Cetobacterium TaxID=180162 RepID=UPI00211DF4D9|nr:S41 family peptidase [Cetobacterium somerae]MCQ9628443.1 S41 family peptidase [Cetobacterium somerae]
MKKYLRKSKFLLVFNIIILHNVVAYSVDNEFVQNIKELKEISDVINIIKSNYVGEKKDENTNITNISLVQGALKGMINSLDDPYSNYFSKEEMESFKEDLEGEYAGIGTVIQKNSNEYLLVVSSIYDTPAFLAGIKAKDRILSIDGESTLNLTFKECADRLKGKNGSLVKLVVYDENTNNSKKIDLKRTLIQLKYVKSKLLKDSIGYLRLTQFGENIYEDLSTELKNLQNNGARGIIFDLRNNPGGSLKEAVRVSSMFISNGKIVSTKGKDGQEEIIFREGKYFGEFPLIILINQESASASEIVSGAIKDYKRGILLGEKTFGKGSVQTLIPLPHEDGIKLTIAKYYTPNGISIHEKGIDPDIFIENKKVFSDNIITNINETDLRDNNKINDLLSGEDTQLEKAIEEMSKLINKN